MPRCYDHIEFVMEASFSCNKTRKLDIIIGFYQNSNSCIQLLKLYLSSIIPHWEYSSVAEIEVVEWVQKYALRVCMISWDLSYDDLLSMVSMQCMLLFAIYSIQDCSI